MIVGEAGSVNIMMLFQGKGNQSTLVLCKKGNREKGEIKLDKKEHERGWKGEEDTHISIHSLPVGNIGINMKIKIFLYKKLTLSVAPVQYLNGFYFIHKCSNHLDLCSQPKTIYIYQYQHPVIKINVKLPLCSIATLPRAQEAECCC